MAKTSAFLSLDHYGSGQQAPNGHSGGGGVELLTTNELIAFREGIISDATLVPQ